jgi:mannose-1-phosphate guanylyltransferase
VHSFKVASEASCKAERIVLVGVEPAYPSTGLGYIHKDAIYDEKTFVYNVHSFTEKPAYDKAKKYIESGEYLWNAGYFIGSLKTFKKSMQNHAPVMLKTYQELLAAKTDDAFKKAYLALESNAIDYALMEPSDDLLVVPATFDWMDLGAFGDLHKAAGGDEQGNHTQGKNIEIEGVENSYIQNHEDKPMAVIGLGNVVVVNTPNGILVARKDLAQKVGEVSKRFKK